jgi:ribosomal protein S18 acetylase RimI-like enzyme
MPLNIPLNTPLDTPPDTLLHPMRPEAFGPYLEAAVEAYADDNVRAGRWPAAGALERSRADFASLLPHGLATPDNHLLELFAAEGGPPVGALWFALERRHGLCGAFVYNIEIAPAHRRQGHARRALQAIEPLAAALGATSIGLHVFGFNAGAQALYRALGYGVTGISMQKALGGMPGQAAYHGAFQAEG